jgi:NAD(P)-dependent dehydrogenase (short-subunit alcohol dehydrogenase family)
MTPTDAGTPTSQTIVITGCSSGFGYHLAIKSARRGDRFYTTMRDLARAESLDLRESASRRSSRAPSPSWW